MKKFVASLVILLLVFLGLVSACGACYWWQYQPELPQRPQK
jgi:cyclic lactone autoinducer peptide